MAARVREVVWAESARDALDEVIEYIAQDSESAAKQVLDEALRAGAGLDSFSERGRIVPELNDPAIREVFVFRYRLLYEVGDARVSHGMTPNRLQRPRSSLHAGPGYRISSSPKRRGS